METGVKTIIGAVVIVIAYLCKSFNELLVVLGFIIISDYILGTMTALIKGQWSYKKGIAGAIKKLGCIFLVMIAFLLDLTITYLTDTVGLSLPLHGIFGLAITCYLIGTEGLSCLRTLAVLGLPIPSMMKKAFGLLSDTAVNLEKRQKNKK